MKKKILKSMVKSAQSNTRVNHFEESDNQFYGGGGGRGGGGGGELDPPLSKTPNALRMAPRSV